MNHIRLIALAAAAMAALTGARTSRLPFLPPTTAFQNYGGGRRSGRGGRGFSNKNSKARDCGIPKAFRQYARRYGSDVSAMVQMHRRIPAPMLDHWRDRREAFRTALFGGR